MKFLGAYIVLILGLLPTLSQASHLIGGEIFYECLGNNNYQFTLKIYRDCSASTGFDQAAAVTVFNSSGIELTTELFTNPVISPVPVVINNPCLTAPPSICIEEAIYTEVINLPPLAGGYYIAYQRCCRPGSAINIINPSTWGSTYLTHVPDPATAVCNNSPSFPTIPPLVACLNDAFVFDHSAVDPDGDSLVYSLCTPFHGGTNTAPMPNPASPPPYTDVIWAPGYSATNPIDANPGFAIDPQTGIITGTPNTLGLYVFGVCVQEYRNGLLITENKRDFQISITLCQLNTQAAIANQVTFCDGLTVSFQNNSSFASSYFWDFGDPTTTADTSSLLAPTYTYPDSGVYSIMLVANPGLSCADTAYSTFNVYPPLTATFPPRLPQCEADNSFSFSAGGNFGAGANFMWNFGPNAIPSSSTVANPAGIKFSGVGEHQVTLTINETFCSASYTDTITLFASPTADFDIATQAGCLPYTAQFTNLSWAETDMKFLWDFGDGGTDTLENPSHIYYQTGGYDVTLTVSTDSGCVDTVSLTKTNFITVNQVPSAGFTVTPKEQSIFNPVFTFENTTLDAQRCGIFLGDGSFSEECNFTYEYKDTGEFRVLMVVQNSLGCFDTVGQTIHVTPEYVLFTPNAFTPNGDGRNDDFRPVSMATSQYEFIIFNRWGERVFETNDPEAAWNGKYSTGNDAPIGVYVWKVNTVTVRGEDFEYYGKVSLLR